MTDEEVIKRRLIFDGDGTGDDRRTNWILKMLTKWMNSTESSAEENLQTYDKILAQLILVEHSRLRSELVRRTNDDQLLKYMHLHRDYEEKIADIKAQIVRQKEELEKAKEIKQNRIHYDMLAQAIFAEPARTETNVKLAGLQKQLNCLDEEKRRLVDVLRIRRKQFEVLSTSANQLQVYLNEDEVKEPKIELDNSLDDILVFSPEPMSE